MSDTDQNATDQVQPTAPCCCTTDQTQPDSCESPIVTIRGMANGPIMITDAKAQKTYGICRCNKSKNLPYCDGSHQLSNFIADGFLING